MLNILTSWERKISQQVQQAYPQTTPGSIQIGPPFDNDPELEMWTEKIHLEVRLVLPPDSHQTVAAFLGSLEEEIIASLTERFITTLADQLVARLAKSNFPALTVKTEPFIYPTIVKSHQILNNNHLLYFFLSPNYNQKIAPDFNYSKNSLLFLEDAYHARLINTYKTDSDIALIVPANNLAVKVRTSKGLDLLGNKDNPGTRLLSLELSFACIAAKGDYLTCNLGNSPS